MKTKQSQGKNDELRMPVDEFDRIMRKAVQASPESMPEREKTARKPKAKHHRRAGK
jgi:hypothetical protein